MFGEVDVAKCNLVIFSTISVLQFSALYFTLLVEKSVPWVLAGVGALASAGAGLASASIPLLFSALHCSYKR